MITVVFKKPISYDTITEHAVVDICDTFGFSSPWFNDDTWIKGDRTLIIGSGHIKEGIEDKMKLICEKYGKQIENMTYEGE